MHKIWIILAALAGASAVAMGAYVSHGLGFITGDEERAAARAALQTAVNYQLVHALALLATGIWAQRGTGFALRAAGGFFTLGMVLFCGLIYLRHLAGFDDLRALVPYGGGCFMLGWLCLGLQALRPDKTQNH